MTAPDAESALIELIRERAGRASPDVEIGIGDDGAVLNLPADRQLVVTVDTLVAGVHFPVGTAPADVGWKSLAVSLSDLAAMGAEPAWALLSLVLPEPDEAWVAAFADGFAELAGRHRVALVGGDTGRGGVTTVTVQAAGYVAAGAALTRRGARPGDLVCVTGTLGDAAAGLACVQGSLDAGAGEVYLRGRLDRPTPPVAAGLALPGRATGAIDLSDGLGPDLTRLAKASGAGARVELTALPASAELRAAVPAESLASYQMGGDDYELCFTVAPERLEEARQELRALDCPVTTIGVITDAPGVAFLREAKPVTAPAGGWRHFPGARDA